MCVITRRHTLRAAAEEDTIKQQQAEADAIGEQQLKQMQLGSSSWSGHNWDAVQSDHMRLVLTKDTTAQGCWYIQNRRLHQTHADMVKEVRPQKHNYVCSKERTVVRRAVLTRTEVRLSSSHFCTVGERRAV